MKKIILLLFVITSSSFSTANNDSCCKGFINENIKLTVSPFDEGYGDGYCEAVRDILQNPSMNCPFVPYIDYTDYRLGKTSYKDGFKAGYRHGTKDAQKYKR